MNRPTPLPVAAFALLTLSLASLPARAHGDGGHGAHAAPAATSPAADTAFGRPGDASKVSRTLTVDMTDNMRFTPALLSVKRGETVRIKAVNKGQVLHELVLGTPAEIRHHAEAMKKQPDMAHDAPSMVHVAPGKDGAIVWQFTRAGEFEFACLLPGHLEAGMRGKVVVQ